MVNRVKGGVFRGLVYRGNMRQMAGRGELAPSYIIPQSFNLVKISSLYMGDRYTALCGKF